MIGGGSFTLSDQLDSTEGPVVINQWASWCVPCRTEIPELSAFADAYPSVKLIGVAVEDTEEAAEAFAIEIEATYDMAMGNAEFDRAYPRLGLPVTYVIDESGRVKEVFNGIVTEEKLAQLVFG